MGTGSGTSIGAGMGVDGDAEGTAKIDLAIVKKNAISMVDNPRIFTTRAPGDYLFQHGEG